MHSLPPALTALRIALGRSLRAASSACPLPDREPTDEIPVSAAYTDVERHDPGQHPPFETIRIGRPVPDAPPHAVTVRNDGPRRSLSITVSGAGVGEVFDETRPVAPGGVVRLELRRPDAYEIRVHAPGRPAYTVSVDPAWFDRAVGLTTVVAGEDGYVASPPV